MNSLSSIDAVFAARGGGAGCTWLCFFLLQTALHVCHFGLRGELVVVTEGGV